MVDDAVRRFWRSAATVATRGGIALRDVGGLRVNLIAGAPDRPLLSWAVAGHDVVAPTHEKQLLRPPSIYVYSYVYMPPLDGSYDVVVPNKTIYVSDGDLPIYLRAQELAGDNLSAAIAVALRRYVDIEEGRREGFDEITVRVGPGKGRKVRFVGVLLGEWVRSSWSRPETFRVYRGRTGKYVVHVERSPDYSMVDEEGKPAGWRGYLGIGNISYGSTPGESTLEVVGTLEELRERIPEQLYDSVAASSQQPTVEDLDI